MSVSHPYIYIGVRVSAYLDKFYIITSGLGLLGRFATSVLICEDVLSFVL